VSPSLALHARPAPRLGCSRERIRAAYWQALDEAINEQDGKQRLKALVEGLDEAGYTAAAKCLAADLDALVVHLRYPTRHRRRWRSTDNSLT
jgi:putative transposase